MTDMTRLPPAYATALRAACDAALDAGLSYEDAFCAFVLERVTADDPARDLCLGTFPIPDGFPVRRQALDALTARVAAGARGTWAICRHGLLTSGRVRFAPVMADGSGSLGTCFDSYDLPPEFAAVHRRMAAYETYLMRRIAESDRARARNIQLIDERRFQPGAAYHNLRIGTARYSTVTIIALHPAPDPNETIIGPDDRGQGWLSLALVKRGSGKRFRCEVSAAQLAHAIDEACTRASISAVAIRATR
jgi:hypothetical protein